MTRPDWDFRVEDRIMHLKPDEIGYQKILVTENEWRAAVFQDR